MRSAGASARGDLFAPRGRTAGHHRYLVDLVQDPGVVLGELDAVGHVSVPPCVVVGIVQAGEPAPAFHLLAARLLYGRVGEQPRLGFLELVDVAVVVSKDRTRGLHVANARELQPEIDPVGLALGLELRDLLVALVDGLLPVLAAHLRLVLRRLLLPEVFLGLRLFLRLVAMVIPGHVSHLSCRGRQRIRPLNLLQG